MFSKACEYGIRAIVYIASETDDSRNVGIIEVCQHIGAPLHFTAKIMQTFTRKQIVNSQKGVNGGFYLDSSQRKKSLKEIVEAIDGGKIFTGCGLGLKECSEVKPCPIHDQFKEVRNRLNLMMQNTSIQELAEKLKSGQSVLVQ